MRGYGTMVRLAREVEEMSQESLAQALGLNGHHDVSRIEREKGLISPEIFDGLTRALPTLRPAKLLAAMGYDLRLPPDKWAVPPELVRLCERVVPFDAATKVALLEYLIRERGREPGPLLLSRGGEPMTANALKIMLHRLEQRAGCNHVTPHAFRRGFARHTRRAGLDLGEVAALMGHATLTMTMRYSQAGEAEAARDAYRRLIG